MMRKQKWNKMKYIESTKQRFFVHCSDKFCIEYKNETLKYGNFANQLYASISIF